MASYPKSGNTWVRIFLQHILGVNQDQAGIPTLSDIPIASNRMLIDNYLGVNSSDLTPQEIIDCRPDVYRALSGKVSELQLLKVHDIFSRTSKGDPLFPPEVTRYVIYIVRNPLDVAVSYSFHSGKSIQSTIRQMNDPEFVISKSENELKSQVPQHLGTWSEHVLSWTEQKVLPFILIQYEQMLEDCNQVFKNMLDEIKIPYNNTIFEKALEASSFKRLKEMEEIHGFREKPIQAVSFFREGKKDIYKNHLDPEQIHELVENHKVIMNNLGYLKHLK